jgi:putative endonuclease
MFYTVYILFSEKHGKIYIGYTSNLIDRFHSHNELSKKDWTRNFRPWKVLYCEYFSDKEKAKKREEQLKGAKGREWIWKKIEKLALSKWSAFCFCLIIKNKEQHLTFTSFMFAMLHSVLLFFKRRRVDAKP